MGWPSASRSNTPAGMIHVRAVTMIKMANRIVYAEGSVRDHRDLGALSGASSAGLDPVFSSVAIVFPYLTKAQGSGPHSTSYESLVKVSFYRGSLCVALQFRTM